MENHKHTQNMTESVIHWTYFEEERRALNQSESVIICNLETEGRQTDYSINDSAKK